MKRNDAGDDRNDEVELLVEAQTPGRLVLRDLLLNLLAVPLDRRAVRQPVDGLVRVRFHGSGREDHRREQLPERVERERVVADVDVGPVLALARVADRREHLLPPALSLVAELLCGEKVEAGHRRRVERQHLAIFEAQPVDREDERRFSDWLPADLLDLRSPQPRVGKRSDVAFGVGLLLSYSLTRFAVSLPFAHDGERMWSRRRHAMKVREAVRTAA